MFTIGVRNVDDDKTIVKFEQEPNDEVCTVLEAMLRKMSCRPPVCAMLVIVDELTVTDTPVPASVRLKPLQPVNT